MNMKPFASPEPVYPPDTIISAATGRPVSFETMIRDLAAVRVIYVGETHTRVRDHEVQLEILKALSGPHPDLAVGMEMFSRPYQPILDDWCRGNLSEELFIERSHWYANWKFEFSLYSPILEYVRTKDMPLYALNIPFHIPGKIAAGGLDSVLPPDRHYLPQTVLLDNEAHREYVREVFDKHGMARRRFSFEHFYQAQCVWEDIMAESIAFHLGNRHMVVFVGNGHIVNKFGIPDRAFLRSRAPFRTVMPTATAPDLKKPAADYFWITSDPSSMAP